MLHFNNIFKYMIFQWRQKALLYSKGLRKSYALMDKHMVGVQCFTNTISSMNPIS